MAIAASWARRSSASALNSLPSTVTFCSSITSSSADWVFGEAQVSVTPLYLSGLTYSVTITDQHMAIGCQVHAIAEWRAFDDRRIAEMDGATGSRFWRDMGPALLALCAATSRPLPANTAEPAPTAVEP